jgi:hypothetical protein
MWLLLLLLLPLLLLAGGNGPVWLQLLHLHFFYLAYLPPGVAQQVLAALTEQH